MKIDSDFDDGIELINKQEVMNLYKSDMKIIIGDGLTESAEEIRQAWNAIPEVMDQFCGNLWGQKHICGQHTR